MWQFSLFIVLFGLAYLFSIHCQAHWDASVTSIHSLNKCLLQAPSFSFRHWHTTNRDTTCTNQHLDVIPRNKTSSCYIALHWPLKLSLYQSLGESSHDTYLSSLDSGIKLVSPHELQSSAMDEGIVIFEIQISLTSATAV